jgi:hypothetical protein
MYEIVAATGHCKGDRTMLTARFVATAVAVGLILGGTQAVAQRGQRSYGDLSVDVGFAALTSNAAQDWYGSSGYNVGVEYRVAKGYEDEQSVSLNYFKSSGQTLMVGSVPTDNWLSSWAAGFTYRKKPTMENKLYFGYGGGLCLMTEKGSSAGVTTSRNSDPSLEMHGLAGVALSDFVRLELGYTQFLRSVHDPATGASSPAGGAFTFTIGGRF